jgi:hypothetical protein
MRLISYDIGIKNLAYCIIEYDDNKKFSILEWNVINLLEKEIPKEQCSQMIQGKTKKQAACKCIKIAKYKKNEEFYCDKHAKKCTFIIPTKKHTKPFLKKLKKQELQQLENSLLISEQIEYKKDEIIEKIHKFYEKQCLEPIIQKKIENAGETDLIIIGKRMKNILNENQYTETITHVLIENQISPIATRMKTLQGMLMQYYIDKSSDINIEFISSVNKLKQFKPLNNINPNISTSYKEHKQSSITYCSQILDNNQCFIEWKEKMDTKKKDDLADSFLQGLWYFQKNNIINYADNLKIKIV